MSVEGFEEFAENLARLKRENTRMANKAVRDSAALYEGILERTTPVGNGIPAGHELNNYEPLASSIVQTGLKKDKDSNSMVDVGFNKSQGWRAHFPNSGTSQQAPQKFIEKSRDRAKPVVLEVMKSYMRKGLNL